MIDKLAATLAKVMQQPAVLARIEKIGAEPTLTTPEELGRIIREDQVRYRLAVKLSGMKVD